MGMQPMLERPRLIGALQRAPQRVAIVGPAGAGKTTLVEQWARYDTSIAVVPVGEIGPEGAPFVAAVVRSLSSAVGGVTLADTMPLETAAAAEPVWEVALCDLLRAAAGRRVVLVVDDADRMSAEQRDPFDALLRRWPAAWRLVVCGQTRPHGLSARMVTDGRAAVFAARDLAFDTDEVVQFARLHGVELERAAAEELASRCGGWPIGVRAAMRTAQGCAGDEEVAALLDELLEDLPPATRRLLEQLAALAPISVDTAATATGTRRIAEAVQTAIRAGVPMIHLDRDQRTVRMDALLAEHLADRLAGVDPRMATALRRRAAAVAEQEGRLADAFRWLRLVGDLAPQAEFVYRWAGRLAARGHGRLAATWLDTFSVEDARANPLIALAIAEVHPGDRRDGDVEFWLRLADRPGWGPLPDGMPDAAVAAEQIRIGYGTCRAEPTVPPGGPRTPMHVSAVLAHAWNQYAAGEAGGALCTIREIAPLARGDTLLEVSRLVLLAILHAERGEHETGRSAVDAANRLSADVGATDHPRTLHLDAVAAAYAAHAGQVDEALRLAEVARRKLATGAYQAVDRELRTLLLLAETYLACSMRHVARGLLADAQALLATAGSVPHLREIVDAIGLRLAAGASEQSDLTGAELRVLRLLATHLTVPRMARQLFIAPSTVRGHLKSIYLKLDVHDRSTAVERAMALGLLA